MGKFRVTAPDGSEIRFASKTRSYSHALLMRHASGRWELVARCGRLDLAEAQLTNAKMRLERTSEWLRQGLATEFKGWARAGDPNLRAEVEDRLSKHAQVIYQILPAEQV